MILLYFKKNDTETTLKFTLESLISKIVMTIWLCIDEHDLLISA